MKVKMKILWAAGAALLAGLFVAEMLTGSAGIRAPEVWTALTGGEISSQMKLIVTEIRLPKAVTALLSGMAISVSGLLMQTLFRNPLAGPYVLGISSGASLGAALCVLGTSASATLAGSRILMSLGTAGAAWLGAAAVLAIIAMASRKAGDITVILILGMMLGAGIDAAVQILQFVSNEQALKSYIVWTMGSMGNVSGQELWILALAVIAGLGITIASCKPLNLLLLGEHYAASMGADIRRTRALVFLAIVLLAGTVTAFCGPVGFVGITAPHIARKLMGTTSHLSVIPATLLTGGIMGAVADLLSRCGPYPLPAGSTMALIGIPIILYIMLRPEKSACISRVSTSEESRTKRHTSRETIHVDGIDIGYGGRTLCSDISFSLHPGDCILLCGANGSGKTTLLRTLASLWPDRVTMIPADIPKVKGFTLEEFIRTGCYTMSDWKGLLSPESERKASEAMDRLRIGQFRDKDISTLSDGEFRKGCIASALCRDSETIILDEPEAFLDTESRIEVLSLLRQIAAEGSRSVIFSSHDIATALKFCNRVAAIGHDHKFRISSEINRNGSDGAASEDSRDAEKIRTARSIFRNKSITFDV